jgi:hypothetical protein
MSVKFKCVASGNVFEFQTDHDIKTMRTHPGYVELQEVKEDEDTPTIRKPGRPKKEAEE